MAGPHAVFFSLSSVLATVHMKNIKKKTYQDLLSIQVRTFQRWEIR
jgi:hypothetical protein